MKIPKAALFDSILDGMLMFQRLKTRKDKKYKKVHIKKLAYMLGQQKALNDFTN